MRDEKENRSRLLQINLAMFDDRTQARKTEADHVFRAAKIIVTILCNSQ